MASLTPAQASKALSEALESIDVDREGSDHLAQIVYMILSMFSLYNLNPDGVPRVGTLGIEEVYTVSEHIKKYGMNGVRIDLESLASSIVVTTPDPVEYEEEEIVE